MCGGDMLKNYYPPDEDDREATAGVVAQTDTTNGVQGHAFGSATEQDAEVLPLEDMDTLAPYGFNYRAVAGTEYVEVDTSLGPRIVGYNANCPVALGEGESAHWFNASCYAHAKSSDYTIQAASIKLGSGAAKQIVIHQDNCLANTAFAAEQTATATDLGKVVADLAALWSAVLLLQGKPGSPLPDGSAPSFSAATCGTIAATTPIATASASTTKAKAE